MINLCKITLFLFIIFLIFNPWISTLEKLLSKNSLLLLALMTCYILLFISLSYLTIRCGYWIIFDSGLIEEVLNGT